MSCCSNHYRGRRFIETLVLDIEQLYDGSSDKAFNQRIIYWLLQLAT
jgi:hypothetical protein